MLFSSDNIFIVTGATSGIGKKLVYVLNSLNASVIAICRNIDKANEVFCDIEHPENLFIEKKNLTEDIDKLPEFIFSLKDKYGKIDGMICCAGIADVCPLRCLDINNIKRLFDLNFYVPLFLAKGFVDKRINKGNDSSLVLVSSTSAITNDKGLISYASSKAAVNSAYKCIAREVQKTGLRVNIISPSDVDTPMLQSMKEAGKLINDSVEILQPEDVVNFIIFLLSENSKAITCQNYIIGKGDF